MMRDFEPPYGDRRQELVFIGIEMDQAVIESALAACLLTDEEMTLGPDRWAEFADPFPVAAADEEPHPDACPLPGETELGTSHG